jgi:hypothetical protein
MQAMTSSLRCLTTTINTHAAAIGVQVELLGTNDGHAAAELLASELTSSFRATIPQLHIHDLCHGTLRVATSLGLEPRAWQPQLLPPDLACFKGDEANTSASLLDAACLPLWNVTLYRGRCNVQSSGTSGSNIPIIPLNKAADASLTSKSVDYVKSACANAFPGFPPSWQDTYCAQFDAHYCIPNRTQVVRLILTARGLATVPAQLSIDGELVAYVRNEQEEQHGVPESATRSDAVVVLSQGCHRISVVYDDAPAVQQGNCSTVCLRCSVLCVECQTRVVSDHHKMRRIKHADKHPPSFLPTPCVV